MSFFSISFLIFFLVIVGIYHLIPSIFKSENHKVLMQQIILITASFIFYTIDDIRFIPFLMYVILISYFSTKFCRNKLLFWIFIILDLLPLLFCKYSPKHWIFPLGISFFTFQSISYIVDVYTKKIEAEKNPLLVILFISFFPVISSGPIQRAGNLIPQLKKLHTFDYYDSSISLKFFAWGVFKKFVIADRLALYVNNVYSDVASQYGLALLLATILYSFQIYCDFSGYSDMAIGIARYLGIDVGKNFDYPYISKSVGEFWRRWHISLSSWLRDYIYIPLGGSHVKLPRIFINLIITFLISGIWHGIGWTFIIWGLIHGLFLCIERALRNNPLNAHIPAWIKIFITFSLVTFAWIFFHAKNISEAGIVFSKFFNIPNEISMLIHMRLNHEVGIIGAIRKGFSDNGFLHSFESRGFSNIDTALMSLLVMIICELISLRQSGLIILNKIHVVLRILIYFIFIVLLYVLISQSLIENIHTQFLYFDF